MAKTVADAIDEARSILQDRVEPYRYSQAELIANLNTALHQARRIRPDIFRNFVGQPTPEFVEADYDTPADFPIDDLWFNAVVYFVVGQAELRDDEFTVDNRAVTLLQRFTSDLRTTG